MFFNFPALKVGEKGKEATVRMFSSRESDDGTTNVDILHVTTTTDEGEILTTHFGIQGRSDHLAEALGQRDSSPAVAEATAA